MKDLTNYSERKLSNLIFNGLNKREIFRAYVDGFTFREYLTDHVLPKYKATPAQIAKLKRDWQREKEANETLIN